ncbi:ABC transporter permease [Faecalicatena acetigenes]|uniref:ABC transporter permease n=1 Tax=Faecalicatena acetigenes TaxID=2981790 RepID=A0ABT2TCC8_9FIRM|nr:MULTISPECIES: ABC transporter permease [Lachnospiraceae]MCU6747871.1 ABC transporter permease [Faecalicatena acetigenes]SCI13961.1 ABC-type transport system involved in multi-copper enzyme maturation%2C permease component [uncultured Clostridium sp.]
MFDMLRMDCRRILKSKSLYICFLLLLVAVTGFLFTFKLSIDDQMRSAAETNGIIFMMNGVEMSGDQIASAYAKIPAVDILSTTIFRGGFFFIIIALMTSLFICSDFDCGFAKNIFSLRNRRFTYILSKWIVIQVVSAVYILLLIIGFILACRMFRLPFMETSFQEYAKFTLLFWLTGSGFSAMLTFVSILFRNKAISVAAALLLASGTALTALDSITSALHIAFINYDYTLYGCIQDISFPVPAEKLTLCLGTSLTWLLIWLLLSVFILQKKDI